MPSPEKCREGTSFFFCRKTVSAGSQTQNLCWERGTQKAWLTGGISPSVPSLILRPCYPVLATRALCKFRYNHLIGPSARNTICRHEKYVAELRKVTTEHEPKTFCHGFIITEKSSLNDFLDTKHSPCKRRRKNFMQSATKNYFSSSRWRFTQYLTKEVRALHFAKDLIRPSHHQFVTKCRPLPTRKGQPLHCKAATSVFRDGLWSKTFASQSAFMSQLGWVNWCGFSSVSLLNFCRSITHRDQE